jgi:nucleoside-diphosphate-sugar epimerase
MKNRSLLIHRKNRRTASLKVLIIGGTGLISTAVTKELLERGEDVTLFNRGRSEAPFPLKPKVIHGDRYNHREFESKMLEAGTFDCVIDMICYSPEDARSLVRAFAGRTGHLIFCSTVDVYAKPASRYPITEAEPHRPPEWDYAKNKEACEEILKEAEGQGSFPLTILRPAFTYGEGRGLVHSFGGNNHYFDRLLKGKPIVVHGDGQSLWSSCHRDDVARGFVNAVCNPKAFGKSYHLTGEEWMTWNQYHQTVAQAIGAPPPKLVHIPTDLLAKAAKRAHICAINFQFNNIFDNTAARTDLGFQYTIPFAEGVRRIFGWLTKHGSIPNSDEDPYDDRVIDAWQRLGSKMLEELAGLE